MHQNMEEEKLLDISELPMEVQASIISYEININKCKDVNYLQDEINRLTVLKYTKTATATKLIKGLDIDLNMKVNELPLEAQAAIRSIELQVNKCFDVKTLQDFLIIFNREMHLRNAIVQKIISDWNKAEGMSFTENHTKETYD